MEKIISYKKIEYVSTGYWVEVEDLSTGDRWFCCVEPFLNEEILSQKLCLGDDDNKIYALTNKGKVWLHTPLGGAIIGRREGDTFGFYENGSLVRCKVIRILSK